MEGTTNPQDMVAVAEAALAAVSRPVVVAGATYNVTASAGLVEREAAGADPAELVRAADITLYWAKAEGRDRWALFDPERSSREVDQYTLAQCCRPRLERGEFVLHYQPLIALADGTTTGSRRCCAGNIRSWVSSARTGSSRPPRKPASSFRSADGCSRSRAGRPAGCRRPSGIRPCVSVNVAMRQLCGRDGCSMMCCGCWTASGWRPSQLQLELTERAVIGSDRRTAVELQALADLGVGIAIDDFGTGYSNMTYLRRLPIAALKLDQSFVTGLRPGAADTRTP